MSYWTHRGGVLGRVKEVGIDVIMTGYSRCFQEILEYITGTRTMVGHSHTHQIMSIWIGVAI